MIPQRMTVGHSQWGLRQRGPLSFAAGGSHIDVLLDEQPNTHIVQIKR